MANEQDGKARWLIQICDWFIPVQSGSDADALTWRARMLVIVAGMSLVNTGWTAFYQLNFGSTLFGIYGLILMAVILTALALLKSGFPVRHLTVFSVFFFYAGTMAVALATGAQWPGGLYFLILVPAAANLMVGRAAGGKWAVVAMASILLLALIGSGDVDWAPISLPAETIRTAGFRVAALLTIAVFGTVYFYSSLHERAIESLTLLMNKFQRGERRFRAIMENAYDHIAELDGEGRITYAGPGFEEVLGWAPRHMIGRHYLEAMHPDDLERATQHWNQMLEKGIVKQEALRFESLGRGLVWIEVSMRSYQLLDGDLRVVVVARDVSERIERDKLIRHQQHLASIGSLATSVAHQLNDPLGSILASAQYARDSRSRPGFDSVASESLHAIEDEARLCGQILRNLLKYSRDEPSERWIEDVNLVVQRTVRSMQTLAARSATEIVLSLCEWPVSTLISPIEIEQVVTNLVRNAIEAKASVVVVGTDILDDDTICITVSDDGVGITEETRHKIFDAFFTTHPGSGSGLGLSIARDIVKEHGGQLYLEETTVDGSVFRMILPTAQRLLPN